MEKKLILVASPPACGKTYVSQQIANALEHTVYLDKDDLAPLIRAAFAAAGEEMNMDGGFYRQHLRGAEYATVTHLAFSTLRYEKYVLVNGPFGDEIRDTAYMRRLKDRANQLGAELLLIWVTAPVSLVYERMKQRNSDRDALKLRNWEDYVKRIDYTPPYALEQAGAVDQFMIFDTKDEASTKQSLQEALKRIRGEV